MHTRAIICMLFVSCGGEYQNYEHDPVADRAVVAEVNGYLGCLEIRYGGTWVDQAAFDRTVLVHWEKPDQALATDGTVIAGLSAGDNIWIDPDNSDGLVPHVLIHEIGHQYGLHHVDDKNDIMYAMTTKPATSEMLMRFAQRLKEQLGERLCGLK